MFCYQCEQTAHGTGCVTKGTCGKLPATDDAQDELTYEVMRLATAIEASGAEPTTEQIVLIMEALFTTVTNVSFGAQNSADFGARVAAAPVSYTHLDVYKRQRRRRADHRMRRRLVSVRREGS